MTADFNKPVKEDRFDAVLSKIRDNQDALAKQDLAGANNKPDGTIQFNNANSRWEKWINGAWHALRSIYEIKVRNSDRLDGQAASYYRNAGNMNAGTLPTAQVPNLHASKINSGVFGVARVPNLHASKINTGVFNIGRLPTINSYTSTSTTQVPLASAVRSLYHWVVTQLTGKLGISAKAADSSLLNGVSETTAATANKIVKRDNDGDIKARLFRSSYAAQTTAPDSTAAIAFRIDTSNNYIRFLSLTAIKSWLGIGNGVVEDVRILSSNTTYRCCRETNNKGTCLQHGTCTTTKKTLQKKINGIWLNVGAII